MFASADATTNVATIIMTLEHAVGADMNSSSSESTVRG